MITIVALCTAYSDGRVLHVNRKFHTGMREFVERLKAPVACILPERDPRRDPAAIDIIEVPLHELPYRVHLVNLGKGGSVAESALREPIRNSALVQCGPSEPLNRAVARVCRQYAIPYVVVTEYTLRTQLDQISAAVRPWPRRLWRTLRKRAAHRGEEELIRGAVELHANGYPTYDSYGPLCPRRFLFLDSRLSLPDVIPESDLRARLQTLKEGRRPAQLIYSGRYAQLKGVMQAIAVGLELLRRGVHFRLDFFGAGPLKPAMRDLVAARGAQASIFVHDPVPYSPDLMEITRRCDLFICCHLQGDPSCTYLETLGAGVPIAGYANEMWQRLCAISDAGLCTEARNPVHLAASAEALLLDHNRLRTMSLKARDFASQHTQERTWELRCDRLNALVSASADRVTTSSGAR
jgi:colanic acid/amylovoran biosynthesis glycosyltransferase